VILYGQGCKGHIQAKMSTMYAKKTVSVDNTNYFYPVNVTVKTN